MNLLALTVEPPWLGWMSLAGPIAIVVCAAAYFKLDARYVLKTEAEKTSKSEREYIDHLAKERRDERTKEVRELENEDDELHQMIKDLAGIVDRHISHYNTEQTKMRSDVSDGFSSLTTAMNAGLLMVSKEVANVQGRLAGITQMASPSNPPAVS